MTSPIVYIDTETTGLDPRIHQPYEVAWWREGETGPRCLSLPHTLEHADPKALEIGGYIDRGFAPFGDDTRHRRFAGDLTYVLAGATLVGSNPAFDGAMLTRFIGTQVWSHRLINVAEGGMWVFGWDAPRGLAAVAGECRTRGFEIPEPDHTAEGDVRTTRAVYLALRAIREGENR